MKVCSLPEKVLQKYKKYTNAENILIFLTAIRQSQNKIQLINILHCHESVNKLSFIQNYPKGCPLVDFGVFQKYFPFMVILYDSLSQRES